MASILPIQIASFPICCSNSRILLPPPSSINHLKTSNGVHGSIKSLAVGAESSDPTLVIRRPAKIYKHSIWDYNYIQSLKSDYEGDTYTKIVDHLKREVRVMLDQADDPLSQLELIDILERLGVSYHFELEIEKILGSIYNNSDDKNKKDLYSAALEFRLLRQHGHNVPQGVFTSFVDASSGNFMHESLDIKGILSLYEASYVVVEGEDLLEKAREFTTKHLQDYVNKNKTLHEDDHELSLLISHSLEFPLHWRVPRLETRWFITNVYGKRHDKNHVLLELAILDFNMVQAIHQKDLKLMSRWWDRLGLPEKLSFSRDRLMECFTWTLGISFEPKFGHCRQATTQMYGIISTADDMYDNYGTVEELKLFTDVIERWDLNAAMEQLPDDMMKFCFLAVYNCINEMGFEVLKKHGIDIIYCLKQTWGDYCRSNLVETEWYYNGYKPSMQEYVDNAWVSVGIPTALVFAYFGASNPITKETLENFKHIDEVSKWAAIISRLADDLEDDMEGIEVGDIPKGVRCHMIETGCSEEDARKNAQDLINTTWKKMNKLAISNSPKISQDFIRIAMNVARMAQNMYQHGDGHASQNQASKERILSLVIDPIPFP